MFRTRTLAVVLIIGLCIVTVGFSQELEDNWNDLLHYTMIGRLDLAKGYAQAIIDSNPDPVALLELSAGNAQGYNLLTKAKDSQADPLFAELCGKVLDIIEQGKFIRRADPKVIVEEIKRLSSTERGKMGR